MTTDHITESVLRYDRKYRANPNNCYHDTYQRMINRIFLTVLFFLYCIMCFVTYSAGRGGGLILFSVCGGIILWCFVLLFWSIKDDIRDGIVDFFTGY